MMDLVDRVPPSIDDVGVEFVVDVVEVEMASFVVVDWVEELPNLEVVNDELDEAVASVLMEDEEEEEHSNPC